MIHAFGDCELDEALFQLRRRGKVVKIEPKVFNVLAYLLRHRDRVVSKDELLDALWPGQSVSESVLPKCVASLRGAVGDAAHRKVIQTIHGRGYRFVAALRTGGAAPPAVAEPGQSPFVGREAAMQRLRVGLDASCSGRGRLLLLVGEPGIGKTRTAEEVGAEASRRQARVLVGRAYEGEGAPAFWPWVQILRACLRDSDPAMLAADMGPGAAEIAELIPELSERIRDVPTAQAVEGEQARFRLFDSVTTFLKRTAARQPVVLILDDLHWADEASLRLLRFLAGELRDARLLVVATYRDVEVRRGHPLAAFLGALARESVCERIALRGFEVVDTERFMAGLIGKPPPSRLVAAVHDMTEGNPFFIQEMVRLLMSEGRLDSADAAGVWPLALPQGVRDAIGRRLNALSDECNALLRTASVLGRDLSAALLAQVADLPGDRLLERLAEAVAAQVLDETEGGLGRYTFRHALIRQTLYDELTPLQRVRLHRRAGEALELACGAHPEPHLAELAHHFFQAAAGGDVEKAGDSCVRAAERAHRLLAYEESARQYEHALQALELRVPRDEARRCELLLALGEAHSMSGARDQARSAFATAAEIARHLSRSDLLGRAALGYRGFEMGAPAEETTLALLEEALAAVGNAHSGLRARLLSRLVGTPPYSHSMERRDALSREAHARAQDEGDPVALRDALFARLWACLGPDRVGERLTVAEEILDLAERLGDERIALLGHEGLLGAHLLRGDTAAADRALAAYTRLAQELRQPAFIVQAIVCQGSRALARGDFVTAEQLFHEALERGRGTVPYAHFMFAGQMFSLFMQRGDIDHFGQIEDLLREMVEMPYSFERATRSSIALMHAVRSEIEPARQEFESLAAKEFADLPRDEHWLSAMSTLSLLAILLGDRRRGAVLYDYLKPYADLVVVHDLLRATFGSVASVLGNLATLLQRYDEGAVHYEHAIAKEAAMEARPALLGSQAGYARLLIMRGQARDRAKAKALIREVQAGAQAIGVRPTALYLTALADLGTPVAPRPRRHKS